MKQLHKNANGAADFFTRHGITRLRKRNTTYRHPLPKEESRVVFLNHQAFRTWLHIGTCRSDTDDHLLLCLQVCMHKKYQTQRIFSLNHSPQILVDRRMPAPPVSAGWVGAKRAVVKTKNTAVYTPYYICASYACSCTFLSHFYIRYIQVHKNYVPRGPTQNNTKKNRQPVRTSTQQNRK